MARSEEKTLRLVDGNRARISRGWLRDLKDDKAFATAVRLGRALNSLTFSLDLLERDYGKSPREKRNGHRAVLIAAGYTYETLLLLAKLEKDFETHSAFSKSQGLLKNRARWEVAEKFRNRSAFHLDSADEITSKTLSDLPDRNYDLYSAKDFSEGMTLLEYYFNLADDIDVAHFRSVFSEAEHRTKDATTIAMINSLGDLMRDVAYAALELHRGLLVDCGLMTAPQKSTEKDVVDGS